MARNGDTINNGKPTRVIGFDSMADMVECGDTVPLDQDAGREPQSISGDYSFTKSKTYDDASKLAFRWDEGAEKVQAIRAQVNDTVATLGFEYFASPVPPGALNMARYLEGHPMPYTAKRFGEEEVSGRGKVVRILVNIAASSGITTDVIETRGGAILSLVDALEAVGRSVELVAVMSASSSKNIEIYTTIKTAGVPLNLSSIAYAIAHPSMLRRHMFRIMEQQSNCRDYGVPGMYGWPRDVQHGEGDIYLPMMMYGDKAWSSTESAAQWVKDRLIEQGVEMD